MSANYGSTTGNPDYRKSLRRRKSLTAGKKLFEITVEAYKVFFIEAESRELALESEIVQDEQHANSRGDFDWEHHQTSARQMDVEQAKYIKERQSELIAKEAE